MHDLLSELDVSQVRIASNKMASEHVQASELQKVFSPVRVVAFPWLGSQDAVMILLEMTQMRCCCVIKKAMAAGLLLVLLGAWGWPMCRASY